VAEELLAQQTKNWPGHSLYKSPETNQYLLAFDYWLMSTICQGKYRRASTAELEQYWRKNFQATASVFYSFPIWRLIKRLIAILGLGSLPMVIGAFLSSLTITQISYAFSVAALLAIIALAASQRVYAGEKSTTIIEFDLNSSGGQNSQTWCLIHLNPKTNTVLLAPESGFWATYGPTISKEKLFSISGLGPILGEGKNGIRINNALALNMTSYNFGHFTSLFFGCFALAIHPEATTWIWYKVVNYVPIKKWGLDCQVGARFDKDLWREPTGWKQKWSLGPIIKKKFNAITAQLCLDLTTPRQIRFQFETSF
jgi:hypothetical protein